MTLAPNPTDKENFLSFYGLFYGEIVVHNIRFAPYPEGLAPIPIGGNVLIKVTLALSLHSDEYIDSHNLL